MERYYNCKIEIHVPKYKNLTRSDRNGTCYFKWQGDKFRLVDPATEECLDCFDIIQHLNMCSFSKSLSIINRDFHLGLDDPRIGSKGFAREVYIDHQPTIKAKMYPIKYKFKLRAFSAADLLYWAQFNITKTSLIKYKVAAVQAYASNTKYNKTKAIRYVYKDNEPCYLYRFASSKSIKLYRPFSQYKWLSTATTSDIFGYDQLPLCGKTLYICSGLKDLMCLNEMKFNAIAPQSESVTLDRLTITKLKSRFKEIIILYDNDSAGIRFSQRHSEEYDVPYIILPKQNKLKDIAEFSQEIGIDKIKQIIQDEQKSKSRQDKRT